MKAHYFPDARFDVSFWALLDGLLWQSSEPFSFNFFYIFILRKVYLINVNEVYLERGCRSVLNSRRIALSQTSLIMV